MVKSFLPKNTPQFPGLAWAGGKTFLILTWQDDTFIVIWHALMNLEFNVAVSQVWIKNLYFLK